MSFELEKKKSLPSLPLPAPADPMKECHVGFSTGVPESQSHRSKYQRSLPLRKLHNNLLRKVEHVPSGDGSARVGSVMWEMKITNTKTNQGRLGIWLYISGHTTTHTTLPGCLQNCKHHRNNACMHPCDRPKKK